MNLLQIRGELSYIFRCGHEVGIWTGTHVLSDTPTAPAFLGVPSVTWQSTDQYNLFYRRRFNSGAAARFWVGLTNNADILFGSDATAAFGGTLGDPGHVQLPVAGRRFVGPQRRAQELGPDDQPRLVPGLESAQRLL